MSRLYILAVFATLAGVPALATRAPAQDQDAFQQVSLRVLSVDKGRGVTIDRGKRDELRVGDNVVFRPRQGGIERGVIREVSDRTAVVGLDQPGATVPVGTRGEVMVPKVRFRKAPPPEKPAEKPAETPPAKPAEKPADKPARNPTEKPADKPAGEPTGKPADKPVFRNKDEDYKPGQPLLQGARPIRPKERPRSITGRLYLAGDLTWSDDGGGEFDNSFARVGVDTTVANPLGYGGSLRLDGEANYRTELDDTTGTNVVPRRLSYTLGGTRFDRDRVTIGRFLQHGVPELQLLDGLEWGRRRENGDRVGASIGYMPEPNEDLETGKDLQVALYYEWVAGDLEELTFTTAFQKTFHHGKSDRDLLFTKLRYLPADGWSIHGAMWLDFYNGKDDTETSDLEVTEAWLSFSRTYEGGSGQDLTYRRTRYPEMLRRELLIPPIPQQVADSRYERISWSGWYVQEDKDRIHTEVGVFQDQDGEGGSGEFGVELADVWARNSSTDVTVFGTATNHETDFGGRIQHGRTVEGGRWDLLYEVVWHHFRGIADDRDDLFQHRARFSRTIAAPGSKWHSTVYAQGSLWDEEVSLSAGFYLQRRF